MAKKTPSLDLPSFIASATETARDDDGMALPSTSVSYSVDRTSGTDRAALPLLPRANRPTFSSHRNDANAALALDLLADVQTAIVSWHQALRETLLEIQKLYMSGPIIEGWLEAIHSHPDEIGLDRQAALLRHGDADQIAAYVDKLSQQPAADTDRPSSQYRLCRLDAEGQMQCELCPPEQLGVIGQAIARNQQLRQLVSQKQYLEVKLKRASEALEVTRQALDLKRELTDSTQA
ncbi:MAG: hypothetical protein ACFBSG_05000 [Leptolyngbyaceae cyanobacterium]